MKKISVKKRGLLCFCRWKKEILLIKDVCLGQFPVRQNKEQAGTEFKLSLVERSFMAILITIRALSLVHLSKLFIRYNKKSHFSELYVLFWLIILAFFLFAEYTDKFVLLLTAYRIIEGFDYRLCIIFVDKYKPNWGLRSINRSLILLVVNYIEMIIGYAILYMGTRSISYTAKSERVTDPIDAIYFSVVTITTLGYGDILPASSLGRVLCIAETLMGMIFVVLVIGTFLTGVSDIRHKKTQ